MKKFKLLSLLTLAAVLSSACGGGGGNSGATQAIVQAINATQPLTVASNNYHINSKDMTISADGATFTAKVLRLDDSAAYGWLVPYTAGSTAENLFGYEADYKDLAMTSSNFSWSNSKAYYYQQSSWGTVRTNDTDSPSSPLFDNPGGIKVTYIDTLAVGGRRMGLTYGDFGYWASAYFKGSGDTRFEFITNPFIAYNAADATVIAGMTGTKEFTGNILGTYTDRAGGSISAYDMYGDAKVTVDFGAAEVYAKFYNNKLSSGNSILNFDDIYIGYAGNKTDFAAGQGMALNADGSFNGNSADLLFDGSHMGGSTIVNQEISGALLGGTEAKETLGSIHAITNNGKEFNAAFGAK